MTKKTETRGRKPKQVDAEMFYQLVCYYEDKPLINVTQNEKLLAEFIHQFSHNCLHFEAMQTQYKKIHRDNPRLTHEEVIDKLRSIDSDFHYALRTERAPTSAYFYEVRIDEKERIHLKNYYFSYFNVDDIHQANRYFQALKKEDGVKLMQRLRKMKFQKSKRYGERKVGIDIDEKAYQKIKLFSDEYGFKTLSIGIIVMSEMAREHFERNVTEALEALYRIEILKPGEVFTSNAETKRMEEWLNDGLVFYSKENYRYYLSSLTFADSVTEGCYEIDFNDSNILRQMKNTNRVFIGDSEFISPMIGQFANGTVNEDLMKDKNVNLTNVLGLQGLLGSSDALKAFHAVENLFLKWELAAHQKTDLLGFDPIKMNICDQDEVQQRMSLVLNIHEQLRQFFDNPENVYGYMSLFNHNAPYYGKRPIDIACESLDGLKLVYNSFSSFGSQAG